MKKSLLLSGMALLALGANAQELKEGYMFWPNSDKLGEYVSNWTPGKQINVDENFYISRVKPKARFRNSATQVNESLTEKNDKKLVFWVPVGNCYGNLNPNARPNGKFDSEVFSTWSYVTHYGDWTAPHGWVPGNFADAAHKNGVAVSGVASIPWGAIPSNWVSALNSLINVDKTKVAQFLHYHGVDGLGYNSEFSGYSSANLEKLGQMHAEVIRYLTEKGNPVAENMWYDGTSDAGSIQFDNGFGSHNDGIFGPGSAPRTSLFFNYNWWNSSVLNSVSEANVEKYAPGRSPLDIYAGHNMQGGDPASWTVLQNYNMSIGLWGAHDFNYLWGGRADKGSSDLAKQSRYQEILEGFFTNGARNPIKKIEVYNAGHHFPNDKWFGMSAFMSARSSLKWDLGVEPFITYFNLGNGTYFNWKGERQNSNEWYNIGVQDYMPTWRYWFANEFLGKEVSNVVANGLQAEPTFEDAYMGGSCLRIHGTSANEYLHMFKTEYALQNGDIITVRYKLMNGKADVNLALSLKGAEGTVVQESALKLISSSDATDDSQWVEKKFTVSGRLNTLTSAELAMVALHFSGAENLDLYLGEFSITRGSHAAPAKPEITHSQLLGYHYKGADAKLVWNMPNNKAAGEPCYNLDVKTSLFKLWAQQEGKEPIMIGATTSWAGMFYSIPMDLAGATNVRIGVSAVSLDFEQESEIAWSEYMALPEYTTMDEIQITKTTIKPNEQFVISYVDPKHTVADWKLTDRDGNTVASASSTTEFVVDGVKEIGAYDLTVTCNGKTTTYAYYVQVSSWEVGAYPEIQSLTVKNEKGEEVTSDPVSLNLVDSFTLGYTGREADGAASRGIRINEGWVGGKVSEIGIEAYKSFSVSAWLKFTSIPAHTGDGSTAFFNIENRSGSWPGNHWGWMWGDIQPDGTFFCSFRKSYAGGAPELKYTFPNTKLAVGAWNHVVLTFEYQGSQFRCRMYVNGVLQKSNWTFEGNSGDENGWSNCYHGLATTDWLSFGGGRGPSPTYVDGIVDELQVWDGVISEENIQKSYKGLDPNNLPAGLKCYWSFDSDATADGHFLSAGSMTTGKAGAFKVKSGEKEGQGYQYFEKPIYEAGSPFIPGSSYKVTTVPTWSSKGAIFSNTTGGATEGSANVKFRRGGDYTVTLTLENSLGLDSKDYPVFKVATGVDAIGADADVNTYVVDDVLFVQFAEAGDYTVSVFDIKGAMVANRTASVESGNSMSLALNTAGVYVVKVMAGNTPVRTIKVMKK